MAAAVEVCGRSATTTWLCRSIVCACFIPSPSDPPNGSPPFNLTVGCRDHGWHFGVEPYRWVGSRLAQTAKKNSFLRDPDRWALIVRTDDGHGPCLAEQSGCETAPGWSATPWVISP